MNLSALKLIGNGAVISSYSISGCPVYGCFHIAINNKTATEHTHCHKIVVLFCLAGRLLYTFLKHKREWTQLMCKLSNNGIVYIIQSVDSVKATFRHQFYFFLKQLLFNEIFLNLTTYLLIWPLQPVTANLRHTSRAIAAWRQFQLFSPTLARPSFSATSATWLRFEDYELDWSYPY